MRFWVTFGKYQEKGENLTLIPLDPRINCIIFSFLYNSCIQQNKLYYYQKGDLLSMTDKISGVFPE